MNITLCIMYTKHQKYAHQALIKIANTLKEKKKSSDNEKKIPFLFKFQKCKFEQTHTHAFDCKYPSTDIIPIHTHKNPYIPFMFHPPCNS